MTATPAEPDPGPLDPVRILHSLPEPERSTFLTAYRQAVTTAADPEGFTALLRLLRLWAARAAAVAAPGYADARAAARRPAAGGMPLERRQDIGHDRPRYARRAVLITGEADQ